ncbi:MAG TPA: hypothetical protein VGG84_06705 [Gemmatimonadaceae bacterium]
MRHSALARVLSAIWGAWLLVALMEPAALHTCPMHDMVHGGMSHAAATHAHDADDGPAHSSSRSHHSVCTCIGSCCAAVVNALGAPPVLTVAETVRQPIVAIYSRLTAYRPSPPEHARPPSQGPPVSLA